MTCRGKAVGDTIKTPDDGLRLELFSLFNVCMKLGVSRKVKDMG